MMYNYVINVGLFVCICVLSAQCQLEEGAKCFSEADKLEGRCANARRCLSVLRDIRSRKYPQLCSFSGDDPIVCCTDCSLVNDTSKYLIDAVGGLYLKTGQKAEDKCLEYAVGLGYPCTVKQGLQRQLDYLNESCYVYESLVRVLAVGGKNAMRRQYPHMALLGFGLSYETAQWLCGGSVISDRFILTAAHCVSTNSVGTVKYAALGILKRTDPPETWQRYDVKRAIRHPGYKPPSKYNDIALLEVATRINFNKDVLPACLNTGDSAERFATATGWGTLGHNKALADVLQEVQLEQFTAEECGAAYPPHRHLLSGYDHKSQSCYGDKQNKIIDTCEGDSGGPLQVGSRYGSCVYKIIGVTSYGRPCGYVGGTGVYTKVLHFVPWIESIVWP